MENIVYKLKVEDKTVEFQISDTTEYNPTRKGKGLGVTIISDNDTSSLTISSDELKYFIAYLTEVDEYISRFNSQVE